MSCTRVNRSVLSVPTLFGGLANADYFLQAIDKHIARGYTDLIYYRNKEQLITYWFAAKIWYAICVSILDRAIQTFPFES